VVFFAGRAWRGQGAVMSLVSGVEAEGMSCLPLSGGAPLGPDGAFQLAKVLRESRPALLTELDLRCHRVTTVAVCGS
jgi:hypothetical protein